MKQLLNSSFVIFCMLTLVVLSIINTVQMNAIERGLLDNQKAMTELLRSGVKINSAVATTLGGASDAAGDSVLKEALADPNNILKAPGRSPNAGKTVV